MKYPKPGPKPKKPLHPAIKEHKGRACVRCERLTGTECMRHEQSMNKYLLGFGLGRKVDDKRTMWGCMECDLIMSVPWKTMSFQKQLEHSKEWFRLIEKTHGKEIRGMDS